MKPHVSTGFKLTLWKPDTETIFTTFARCQLSTTLMETLNWNGCTFVQIDPEYTSQTCPVCSHVEKKNRDGKNFKCVCCGHKDDADHVGSINIGRRARDPRMQKISEAYPYDHNARKDEIKKILLADHEKWLKAQKEQTKVS